MALGMILCFAKERTAKRNTSAPGVVAEPWSLWLWATRSSHKKAPRSSRSALLNWSLMNSKSWSALLPFLLALLAAFLAFFLHVYLLQGWSGQPAQWPACPLSIPIYERSAQESRLFFLQPYAF